MKNFFSKLIGLLAFTAATTFADVVVYNPSATNAVAVLTSAAKIQQMSIANGTGSAITITALDSPSTALTYVVGAYTNNVQTISDVVTTFTNILGVSQSSTNTTLINTPTLVSASTNNYRTVLIQTVPANSTVTFTPPTGLLVGFGMNVSCSATGVTATVSYLPTR